MPPKFEQLFCAAVWQLVQYPWHIGLDAQHCGEDSAAAKKTNVNSISEGNQD